MLYQGLIIFQVLVAASIIALVLLQQGRGADAGAAFGSGASGTVFGARGAASFLTRTTAVLAVLFFSSSLFLATLGGSSGSREDLIDFGGIEEPAGELPSAPAIQDPADEDDPLSDVPVGLPENGSTLDFAEPKPQGGEGLPDVPVVESDLPAVAPPDRSGMDDGENQ